MQGTDAAATVGSSAQHSGAPEQLPQPRRLPMDHELFTEGNLRREVLAKQTLAEATADVALPDADALLW